MDNHRSLLFSSLICCLVLLASGCASRENATFQNATARYNLVYNAERLLNDYLKTEEAFVNDDYNDLLPIFKKPKNDTDTKLLDSVILKANTIINKKTKSDYLDNAYFLIAEANFLKGNFYDAAEFYSYIYSNYPKETELAQLSRMNKARALLSLNNIEGANAMLDSALKYSEGSNETLADLFALETQLLITQNKFEEAEQTLERALSARPAKWKKQRWMFLLAQLQEKNNRKALALQNFKSLRKSVAPTELAFHADIHQSRIYNALHGSKVDEILVLRTFLDNDLYIDYQDRIFYMLGKIHEQRHEVSDALMNYKNSVRASTSHSNQKGIAYAALAQSYFKSGLYQRSLSYYDSALSSLPTYHSRYADIKKKAESLNHLAGIFEKINLEETLQRIANLPQDRRQHEVTELIRMRNSEEAEYLASSVFMEKDMQPGKANFFYFNNPRALKQGALDFGERWGSRILKDDWRYQVSGTLTAEPTLPVSITPQKNVVGKLPATAEWRFEDYINNLPIGEDAINASNERIAASLYEIGISYLNKLQDPHQATATFEKMAGRFSETSYALPAYYRLYLIKRQTEPLIAKRYEDIILTKYPESEIADIIRHAALGTDPAIDASDATYTRIYSLFANKQYKEVIRRVDAIREKESSGSYSTQLDYLYTISMGYAQSPRAFEDSLQSFAFKHAQDSLVTPLVRQHLEHIKQNRESFSQRPVALVNNEIAWPDQNIAELSMRDPSPEIKKGGSMAPKSGDLQEPVPRAAQSSNITPATELSMPHYFVVNILSATTNLSPSRFGIGQFNRSMYPALAIKHQLKVVNKENQLIFVGPFQDKEKAVSYEARILPMIKEIMKIPAERYNTFIISQKGLGQLNTREQIQSHIEHTTKNIK